MLESSRNSNEQRGKPTTFDKLHCKLEITQLEKSLYLNHSYQESRSGQNIRIVASGR